MIRFYKIYINEISKADYINEYNLLYDITKERIASKASIYDKKRSLAGLILLRRAIFDIYNITEYNIRYSKSGKPILDFCRFSISHSGELVVCAVSDKDIGVDAEQIRTITSRNKYKFFSEKENLYINSGGDELSIRFLEIWTKKEALAKLLNISPISSECYDVTEKREFLFKTIPIYGYIITLCIYASDDSIIEFD